MSKASPIHLGHLLPTIDGLLLDVLQSLNINQWSTPTLAGQWTVKDIATHLLDGNLRALSMLRDGHFSEAPADPSSYNGMVKFLNRLNADWVGATHRLSPEVLIMLLKVSGQEYCTYMQSIDPEAPATFSVAWAGEEASKNWFHIAREYTEKWHHQQQIRLATNSQVGLLLADQWYQPYLDTSVRALPFHYRNVEASAGDTVKFVFQGETDKVWYLHFSKSWELMIDTQLTPDTEVVIPDTVAWKIFTKGISREEAIAQSQILGKRSLGLSIFELVAVMA